ncbi:hypothetical protein BKA82DRAFT_4359709 [Pisolithus tinctorius]|nr:hypothetical protein BKA82DRAFT_4359709 [Pisolithus tinctorius]
MLIRHSRFRRWQVQKVHASNSSGSLSLLVALTYRRLLLVIIQYPRGLLSGKGMIVPEKPVTFFVDIPPRPGVTLERDDVPIFRQLFPVRRQRSKLYLNPPSVARQVASFVFGSSHTNPRHRSYITSVTHRHLGRSNSSKYLVDKHSNIRVMDAELKNQLPVSLQRQSSRLDPAKTHSTKPKRVCHPAHTPTPVVAVEHVAPTTLSQDPPAVTSSEKPSESMAFDNSRAEIHPPSSRSSQPINLVSPSAPPAGIDHIQLPEGERRLSRVCPSARDTYYNPTATHLPTPTHPAQQPHGPAVAPSIFLHKPATSSFSPGKTQTRPDNIASAIPITPQLFPNHPYSQIPIPATATTAAVVNWPLKRTQKAIRKQKEYVTFYRSFSEGPLDSPPDVPEAYEHPWKIADLYVHHNQTERAFQVWIRSETGVDQSGGGYPPSNTVRLSPQVVGQWRTVLGSQKDDGH